MDPPYAWRTHDNDHAARPLGTGPHRAGPSDGGTIVRVFTAGPPTPFLPQTPTTTSGQLSLRNCGCEPSPHNGPGVFVGVFLRCAGGDRRRRRGCRRNAHGPMSMSTATA